MLTTRPPAHLPPRAGFISALGAAVAPSAVVSAPVCRFQPMAGGSRPRLRADGARFGKYRPSNKADELQTSDG